jgi:phosphatidylinositol alpha-1,6-mannosyltransferase
MMPAECGVLGLFPGLEQIGGTETSGRLAWQSLAPRFQRRYLLTYSPKDRYPVGDAGGTAVQVRSKLRAAAAAIANQWPVELVLIWHIGLLKLIPLLRVRHAKVVLFLHGIEAWRAHTALNRALLRRVDLFLCNSEYTWTRFIGCNPGLSARPHVIVPLGCEASLRQQAPVPRNPPTALMLGRMVQSEGYKGHLEMLCAWPQVRERLPEAELWIAGPGDLEARLRRIVREQAIGGVRFFGEITERAKTELLDSCRCLALPSRGEGFGMVYLEAMRRGRPCLVGNSDAGREVVNPPEAGIAADPSDANALSDAVCRLLTPGPDWEALSRQARERYDSLYTAEQFQQRLITALSGCLNQCER